MPNEFTFRPFDTGVWFTLRSEAESNKIQRDPEPAVRKANQRQEQQSSQTALRRVRSDADRYSHDNEDISHD